MKQTLRWRLFRWLVVLLLIFVGSQAIIYGMIEFRVWQAHQDESLREQLMEVVHGVAWDLAVLPFLIALAWWISRRMIEPIRAVSLAADTISAGHYSDRILTDRMPDDEMRHMAMAVNSAFDHYSDAVNRLRRFTGDASHQLRTPLAVIRSIGEVTLSRERSPEEYRQALGNILDEVRRLTKVTDQLLQLARLERTEVSGTFARTDLVRATTRTAAIFQSLCDEKGVGLRVEVTDSPEVMGNETLLVEMLANLLDNALRATPAGGEIVVKVDVEIDGTRLVTVADTGPGIPAEYADRLFELFSQVPGSQPSGAGLGLAIVSAIARVHGGKAELNRQHTRGAVFHVRLPEP